MHTRRGKLLAHPEVEIVPRTKICGYGVGRTCRTPQSPIPGRQLSPAKQPEVHAAQRSRKMKPLASSHPPSFRVLSTSRGTISINFHARSIIDGLILSNIVVKRIPSLMLLLALLCPSGQGLAALLAPSACCSACTSENLCSLHHRNSSRKPLRAPQNAICASYQCSAPGPMHEFAPHPVTLGVLAPNPFRHAGLLTRGTHDQRLFEVLSRASSPPHRPPRQ